MNQNELPLLAALDEYNRRAVAYFRIPGHRGARGVNPALTARWGEGVFAYDLSETPLTDDLHQPEGAIARAQALTAEAFGADESFFLVNGTTCGVEAMVLAAAAPGETVLLSRGAHKSALMGLVLSGARPAWIEPEVLDAFGLSGGVRADAVEAAFAAHPEAKAVLLVSPTYYGLCSDLAAIAEVCHRHGAALLVDEAHGAHFHFADALPPDALAQGADACAQSIHKVGSSLGQSSLLHLRGSRLDSARVKSALHLVQSTSPSYLLMASLDAARQEFALRGAESAERAIALAQQARARLAAIPGLRVLGEESAGRAGIAALDPTRVTFSAAARGLTGHTFAARLFARGVDTELTDHRNVLALLTAGNTQDDVDRLVRAAQEALADAPGGALASTRPLPPIPPQRATPREAYFASARAVLWRDAIGRTAAEAIIPYPPGVPVLCPGEVVTEEVAAFVDACRADGVPLHGPADASLAALRVMEE